MQLQNAGDWVLKAQGAANRVCEYVGNDQKLLNTVLRVRRNRTGAIDLASDPAHQANQQLEREVWGELTAAQDGLDRVQSDAAYVTRFLEPFLGAAYLPPTTPVSLHGTLSEALQQGAGVLMPDATRLPDLAAPPSPTCACVCLEIKPKCGLIARCATVRPEHRDLKHQHSRYALHQRLKLQQQEIERASGYDPLDLFSGDALRMQAALGALLEDPQNNLMAFVDGVPRPLRCAGDVDAVCTALLAPRGRAEGRKAVVELLCQVLQQEDVLARILKAQGACAYDIEGVYRLYRSLLPGVGHVEDFPSLAMSDDSADSAGREHAAATAALLSRPRAEALAVLQSYCIAATAKDCAIMIALQRMVEPDCVVDVVQQAQRDWGEGGVVCSGGAWWRYRVTVVDLDRKPLAKIRRHHELDGEIMRTVLRKV